MTDPARMTDGQPGRLRFAGLGYALAVLLTGTNLATPLYAIYEHVFRLSPLDVTLLVAVYAAAVVVALLICGPLSDTAGYRPVLVAGLAVAACGSAMLAAATGPGWLFAGRAVQGLAVGTCSGALTAGLVLTEPRGRRARASFLAATVTTAACGFGPVLAGALAQYAPAPRVPQLPGGDRPAGPGGRGGRPAARLAGPDGAAVAAPLAEPARPDPGRVPGAGRGEPAGLGGRVRGAGPGPLLRGGAGRQQPARRRRGRRLAAAGRGARAGGLPVVGPGPGPAGRADRPGRRAARAHRRRAWPGSVAAVLFGAMAVAGAGQGLAFMGGIRRINEIAPAAARAGTVAMFYVVTYAGSGLVTVGVGLLATLFGLAVSVRWSAAVLAAACLLVLAALPRRQAA